ncbi:hypothetical protein AB1Y20_018803 [Prymnesium parvum]|uniref:C2 NT-type domain-containing protein n=1 Tax=Prymnesium parvum TaxID=97485 RepID=A0AB34JTI5_PRYPA
MQARPRGGGDLLGLSRLRLPGRHHGDPVKFEFSLSELTVHLNSQHDSAVCVDNLVITWRRGQRTSTSKPIPVVETLDQASGNLSRTALLLQDLTLPVTLFRMHHGERSVFEPKPSELEVAEATAEEEEYEGAAAAGAFYSSVVLDLAAYASAELHVLRTRVALNLPGGAGSLGMVVSARQLVAARADDDGTACSVCSGDTEHTEHSLADHPHLESAASLSAHGSARAEHAGAGGCAACNGCAHGAASSRGNNAQYEVEQRWQAICEFERARADKQTIESLHKDIEALIQDKKRVSEENLRLSAIVAAMPADRRALGEKLAALEAELARTKKEASAMEVQQAEAFNSVVRSLEQELESVTRQRDAAITQLEKASRRRTLLPHSESTSPPHPSAAVTNQPVGAPQPAPRFGFSNWNNNQASSPSAGSAIRRVISFDRKKGR